MPTICAIISTHDARLRDVWGSGGEARWIGDEAGWAGGDHWAMAAAFKTAKCLAMARRRATPKPTGGWFWKNDDDMRSLDCAPVEDVSSGKPWGATHSGFSIYPNQTGKLPDTPYVARLKGWQPVSRQRLADLALSARATASDHPHRRSSPTYDAPNLIDGDKDTYWAPPTVASGTSV